MPALVLPAREVLRTTPRTRIIRLDLTGTAFPYAAGQAVMAGLHDSPVRKPYSIACSPAQAVRQGALELLVQIDDSELPDPHFERLVPTTPVDIDGPFGWFTLTGPPAERDVLFIAGGTGIAPLRAMLWQLIETRWTGRTAMVYSARSPDEFAYRDELEALAHEGALDLRLTVTRGADPWPGRRGRLNHRLIADVLATPDTRCYLCGPPALVLDATAMLTASGVRDESILAEKDG